MKSDSQTLFSPTHQEHNRNINGISRIIVVFPHQVDERKVRDRSLLFDRSPLLLRINSLFCFLGNFPATHCYEYRI
jgi:hypothetical protein